MLSNLHRYVTLDEKFKYNEFTWRVLMKYNTCIHFEPRGGYPSQMRFHLSRHETRNPLCRVTACNGPHVPRRVHTSDADPNSLFLLARPTHLPPKPTQAKPKAAPFSYCRMAHV